jgi:hypothetical protein
VTDPTHSSPPGSGARWVEVPSPERYRQDVAPARDGHAAQGTAPTAVLEPRAVLVDVVVVAAASMLLEYYSGSTRGGEH